MALGIAGSSLTAELNRLAGITNVAQYLDEQGAANRWAGTTGLSTVGALNIKAQQIVHGTSSKTLMESVMNLLVKLGLQPLQR